MRPQRDTVARLSRLVGHSEDSAFFLQEMDGHWRTQGKNDMTSMFQKDRYS